MIHTIKNIKWVLATFSICVLFGLVTFFTLINHKYNPDRKLFPEKAWEKREQQGFRKLNDTEKTFLFLEYIIPHSMLILLVVVIALLDI